MTELPATGTLLSYTRVWVARKDLPAPYMLGQIDLDAGAFVFAHVRGLADDAVVPLTVRLVCPNAQDGPLSFWFEPTSSNAAD